MYPTLGNTGIKMYDLLNAIAALVVFIYNISNLNNKNNELSKFFSTIPNRIQKKNKTSVFSKPKTWLLIETVFISFIQFVFLAVYIHTEFGLAVQTPPNYFGTLFFKPIMLCIIFYIISTNPLKKMDLITPAYPLALIFAKLGCFCLGCCNGFECSWGLYNHENMAYEFPVQLLEAGLALSLFLFLIRYKKRAREGTLFPIYLILYSVTRFFSEFTRAEYTKYGPLKAYQVICIIGLIVGVAELLIALKFSERIKSLFDRNITPWKKEKNIIHHKKR